MSSLQPNPPSKSHANTFTHTHTHECTLTLSPLPCLCCFPFSSTPFVIFAIPPSASSLLLLLYSLLFSLPSSPLPSFLSFPPRGVSQGARLIQQLFVWSAVDRAHGFLWAQRRETERGNGEIMAAALQ